MSTTSVRVVEVIPGKSVVGLEIPNADREIVALREILDSTRYSGASSAVDARAGQGHRRQPGHGRSGQDAAHAGGGHHRFGQVRGGERHDSVDPAQGDGRRGPPDHDRPEDAGTVGLRRHPASAGAGCHRHEGCRQRAALVRGRDGAPLQAHGRARRAQHGGLQRQGAARPSKPASRSRIRSRRTHSRTRRPRPARKCRHSSRCRRS